MSADLNINYSTYGEISKEANALVIELSDNLIQFCELESEYNKPLYIVNYPIDHSMHQSCSEHLINALRHFQFSKKKYEHVSVNYFNSQFTLCPGSYYNPENNRALLEFNSGAVADKLIFTDDIGADIKSIYAIDETLKSTLDQVYPHHQLKHTLSVLSRLMLQTEELLKEDIILSVHSNYIELVVKQDHKLILTNQFSIKTQEDVLYYVLFILEQYQLNPLTVNITVTGNLESNSGLITSLKKYIKNIRLAIGHKNINWSNIKGTPQHFNYTLLNRLFCE